MSYFVDAIASADNIRITPSLRSKKGKLLKMSAEYLPYLGLYNAHWCIMLGLENLQKKTS
jgi:hypothetical protein